jgi:SAM-dependent methyltransferase
MPLDAEREVAQDWDAKATDWDAQVGEDGDANRQQNSDPVLWRMLGPVRGRRVLDAGCGTGYLSRRLAREGASVTGVDLSAAMVALAERKAHERNLSIDHRVASTSSLHGLEDASFDAVVSNYVLMDAPDLPGAAQAIARVLKPGGVAVSIFSHPCFPQAHFSRSSNERFNRYDWPFDYFEPQRRVDPAWRHFSGSFTWFHRPLSHYTRVFRAAGLLIDEIDEPSGDGQQRPYSIAFRLLKPS